MAVEKKLFQKKEGAGILSYLVEINNFLEKAPFTIVKFFHNAFQTGQKVPQKGVDMICEWCAWRINTWIEWMRQKAIRALYNQYGNVLSMLPPVEAFKEIMSNPLNILGAVASAVKKVINLLIGPFKPLYEFIAELAKQLFRLARNLAAIMSILPPDPPDPDISFDKFKLKINSIGMQDITTDPSNLPNPEEVFKEPTVPFSKEYFAILGGDAVTQYREELPFYSLPSNYKGSLTTISRNTKSKNLLT